MIFYGDCVLFVLENQYETNQVLCLLQNLNFKIPYNPKNYNKKIAFS